MKFVGSSRLQLHSIFENKPIGPIGHIPSFICVLSYTLLLYNTYYYTVAGNFMGCLPSYYMFGVCVSVSWTMREILPICELLILMWILKCMHLVDKGILCLLECSSQGKRSAMARPNKCAGTVHLLRLWTGNRLWSHLLRMSGLFNKTIHNNDIGGIPIWLGCLDWTNVYIFQRWYNYNIVQYASTIFWRISKCRIHCQSYMERIISSIGILSVCLLEAAHTVVDNTILVSSKLNALTLSELSNHLGSNDITKNERIESLSSSSWIFCIGTSM